MISQSTEKSKRPRFVWSRRRQAAQIDAMRDLLVRIDTALVVRDPGTARSAEAFEGLRKQVIAAASDRRKHVVQLTELAEALRRGETAADLASRAEEWLLQANVAVLDDPAVAPEAFEHVGGDGPIRSTSPAYVDAATGMVIRRGTAEGRRHEVEALIGPAGEAASAGETVEQGDR